MSFNELASEPQQQKSKDLFKMQELLKVSDISELELIPFDEDNISESEDNVETPCVNQTPKHVQKLIHLYKPIRILGAGGFGIVVACKDR